MLTIVAGLAMSLGGVIESPSDWWLPSEDMDAVLGARLAESDAVLLGLDPVESQALSTAVLAPIYRSA